MIQNLQPEAPLTSLAAAFDLARQKRSVLTFPTFVSHLLLLSECCVYLPLPPLLQDTKKMIVCSLQFCLLFVLVIISCVLRASSFALGFVFLLQFMPCSSILSYCSPSLPDQGQISFIPSAPELSLLTPSSFASYSFFQLVMAQQSALLPSAKCP